MAEQTKKGKLRGALGVLWRGLLILAAMAAAYTLAVVLHMPTQVQSEDYVVVEDPVPVTPMQPASMNDPQGLARLFEAPIPALPGYAVSGEGGNTAHDGETARVAVLRYEGLTIMAVQPASAAPLLLREELNVSLRGDVTVLGLPAVMAERDGAFCVYFSNSWAAYSVYASQADEASFFAALEKLSWAQ